VREALAELRKTGKDFGRRPQMRFAGFTIDRDVVAGACNVHDTFDIRDKRQSKSRATIATCEVEAASSKTSALSRSRP